jgi:hypothetical protein
MTEGVAHEWAWDDVFKVYRCLKCLVSGAAPHGPTCPKGEPQARPEVME